MSSQDKASPRESRSNRPLEAYWSLEPAGLLAALGSSEQGLSAAEAARRLESLRKPPQDGNHPLRLYLKQFANPLMLILVFGAALSAAMGDRIDAAIISAILLGSATLGFSQEYRASAAIAKLRQRLSLKATALRDGVKLAVPAAEIVPGDVLLLSAGNLVPADGVVLEAKDLLVSEAALTGESFPVEKHAGRAPPAASLAERLNCVFQGTSVRSGTGTVLVVKTGADTEFGKIGASLHRTPPETDFARGLRRFGLMLTRVMLIIVIIVLVVNLIFGRPIADTLLFAVALAIGLSPEMLPAIVSVTLSMGARTMAASGVIVRRLEAIENLGSMNILCTDKTGTLTTGVAVLDSAVDPSGTPSADLLRMAYLNAAFETGIDNPLDAAIAKAGADARIDISAWRKIDEIPYDFLRRRLTIVVAGKDRPDTHLLISKGALEPILDCCSGIGEGGLPLDAEARERLLAIFRDRSKDGLRVLGLAAKQLPAKPHYGREDETGLSFMGFLLLRDPPKPDAAKTVAGLHALGVRTKILTGDNRFIAANIARDVGLNDRALLTGQEIDRLDDAALWHRARRADLFAEIDPQQKERIIHALRHSGNVVGFLGDGVNDAPALHAADVGVSVEGAVDVARESADIVLLKPDLGVLRRGIEDGRRTFVNTQKYIAIVISGNFGNMVSMAAASLILPFLPLLAKQILLNNFLADIPSVALSTDHVDPERIQRPPRWNVRDLQRFMVVFGLISSAFDALTFLVLLRLFHAGEALFQTGWFVVSLMTELCVILVLRTQRPAFRSRPGRLLLWTAIVMLLLSPAIPYADGFARVLSFLPLSASQMLILLAIVPLYVVTAEFAKRAFYRRVRTRRAVRSSASPNSARG